MHRTIKVWGNLMKKYTVAMLALTLAMTTASVASAQITNFSATIDGAQEVPPTGSPGTGTGTFVLDEGTSILSWNITFSGLAGTETAAHIHGPGGVGVNAGVQIPLSTGSPKVGSAALSPAQIADLKAGLYYVNIHSTVNAGGEIRGQILALPDVPASRGWSLMLLALALVGTAVLLRRRLAA
jgi:hypothetical protein